MHFWSVPTARVPVALSRMVRDRSLRHFPGVEFVKLLGTGAGRSFTPLEADWHRWGILVAWSDPQAAARFENSDTVQAWNGMARERLRVLMHPLASRGAWSRRRPFGRPAPARWHGPVAAVTRARLRWSRMPRFSAAAPAVSDELWHSRGLVLATGIGEAPIGLQGTFSIWSSAADLSAFAYRGPRHTEAIAATPAERWYVEELFARFAVLEAVGGFAGKPVALPSPRQ